MDLASFMLTMSCLILKKGFSVITQNVYSQNDQQARFTVQIHEHTHIHTHTHTHLHRAIITKKFYGTLLVSIPTSTKWNQESHLLLPIQSSNYISKFLIRGQTYSTVV